MYLSRPHIAKARTDTYKIKQRAVRLEFYLLILVKIKRSVSSLLSR